MQQRTLSEKIVAAIGTGSSPVLSGQWVQLTQEEYDNLTPEPGVLYVIIG